MFAAADPRQNAVIVQTVRQYGRVSKLITELDQRQQYDRDFGENYRC